MYGFYDAAVKARVCGFCHIDALAGGGEPSSGPFIRRVTDDDRLRTLYLDSRLTMAAIAARMGCGESTVRRRLVGVGVRPRPRGPSGRSDLARAHRDWTASLAYAVGLIATDGCLSRVGHAISIASKDFALLDTVRRCLRLTNAITPYSSGRCYHIQWRDRWFHQWLIEIGLTPAKSLTLGAVSLPTRYLRDFVRGCIDGDGTIVTYVDRSHMRKNAKYVYERLYVSVVSASPRFIGWLQEEVANQLAIVGDVSREVRHGRHPLWRLRYAKAESIRLLQWIYYAPDVPCLARKRAKAEPFLELLGQSARRPVGQPRAGWLYNGGACRGGGTRQTRSIQNRVPVRA